jgi:hypothetical protein
MELCKDLALTQDEDPELIASQAIAHASIALLHSNPDLVKSKIERFYPSLLSFKTL